MIAVENITCIKLKISQSKYKFYNLDNKTFGNDFQIDTSLLHILNSLFLFINQYFTISVQWLLWSEFQCLPKGGGILTLSRDQCSFVDKGHIYWCTLMKCCMVACINILYPQNWLSAAAEGSAVSCFLRVSDHLESICKKKFHWKFWLPELSRCMTSSR